MQVSLHSPSTSPPPPPPFMHPAQPYPLHTITSHLQDRDYKISVPSQPPPLYHFVNTPFSRTNITTTHVTTSTTLTTTSFLHHHVTSHLMKLSGAICVFPFFFFPISTTPAALPSLLTHHPIYLFTHPSSCSSLPLLSPRSPSCPFHYHPMLTLLCATLPAPAPPPPLRHIPLK